MEQEISMRILTGYISWMSLLILLLLCSFIETSTVIADDFVWPEGTQAAVSLTFDDGTESQVDVGIPLLNQYGVRATFYVVPKRVKQRLGDWQAAVISGHEIGNHSMTHPCRCTYSNAARTLENYTLERMAEELDTSNLAIEMMLGVSPVSFAYPCGHNYVGRGKNAQSYVPIAAERFQTCRSWLDEFDNDPVYCDLTNLMSRSFDCLDFEQVKALIDSAKENGYWLILAGHNIGDEGDSDYFGYRSNQVVYTEMLKSLCEYANNPENGIWVAPVAEVASYIEANRTETFSASFVSPKQRHLGAWITAALASFLGSFLIMSKASPKFARLILLNGAIGLLLLSCWSIRYGFIGYKPFTIILIIIGFLLGCSCTMIRQAHLFKK
jgi:peptidoglycan/xylan/chitin deacetylase (PgdA/CDA1 family)